MSNWLNDYLNEIGNYQDLTKEELAELGKKIKNKNSLSKGELNTVKNKLLKYHMRLIVHIANHYAGKGIEYEELIEAGIDAILNKSENWDYTIAPAFSTYIWKHIAGEMTTLFKKAKKQYNFETSLDIREKTNKNDFEIPNFLFEHEGLNESSISSTLLYRVLKYIKFDNPTQHFIFQELLRKTKLDTIQQNSGLDSSHFSEQLVSVKEKFKEVLHSTDLHNVLSVNELADIYANLHLLPSDETMILDYKQEHFSQKYRNQKSTDKLEAFYQQISDIKDVPSYKYVLNYLIETLSLSVDTDYKNNLWDYLSGKWSFAGKAKNEYQAFMQMIRDRLQSDFQKAGVVFTGNINTYVKDHILNLSEKGLCNLVLTYHMDLETYTDFRKKVLKVRESDFLNKDFIYLYLVIQYADTYDLTNWKEAYDKLNALYGSSSIEVTEDSPEHTSLLRENMLEYLENTNENFFIQKSDELSTHFSRINYALQQGIQRSPEEEFQLWWNVLLQNISMYHHSYINYAEQEYRAPKGKTKEYKLGTEVICRFLYGSNTGDISPKNPCKKIKPESSDFFLDSHTFEKTRITDDVIRNFSKKNDPEKRNLLLTVIFLNFAYDMQQIEYKNLDYKKRVTKFKLEVADSFSHCGYLVLHNTNAYDRFLQNLLLNYVPLDLYRHIWYEKTNSVMHARNEVNTYNEQKLEK